MATKKEVAKEAYEAYSDFITLCRTFFGKNPIDNVTSLDKDSVYYKASQEIAKEFGMDWDNLSPEDSNELMLALLEDYYNKVSVNDEYDYILSVTVKEKQSKKTE